VLPRLPGVAALPFQIDRRELYRISDLYKGYDLRKPDSWARAFDHTVYNWTLDPNTATARQLEAHEVVGAGSGWLLRLTTDQMRRERGG
jgi:hypothetical protein